MAEAKNQPNYECGAYKKMSPGWEVVADVCAGTLHLRSIGPKYLPPETAEAPGEYGIRRSRAIFFNAFERTLHGLVGMVFRKEPKLAEDVPLAIRGQEKTDDQGAKEGLWENIDNAGAHGSVFCKEVFTDAMRDGHAAILVDMPPALPEGATREDEMRLGRRPYWVGYCAEQIINWRTEVIGGKARLSLVVLREKHCEPDGEYGEMDVIRYRVLRPGSWELYREATDASGTTILLEDSGLTSLTEIPFAVVYSRKMGFLCSRPPLLDLAFINLAHYQKYSDLSIYLHLCKPILWFNGRDKAKKVEPIGPYTIFDVDGQSGNVAFAEPTGAALGASREDLIDLEQRMSVLGLSLLSKKNPTPTTATEEILTNVKEESDLATAARSLKDAIESCLKWTAQYLDAAAKTGGSVELGATVDEMTLTDRDIVAYSNMVASKQLSLDSFWAILERAGKLPEDFDEEKEKEQIEADAQVMAERMLTAFEQGGGNANLGDGEDQEGEEDSGELAAAA